MKYTYDPATCMPDLPDLDQEFEVTLTRRDLETLMIAVQSSLDGLRYKAAKDGDTCPSFEGAVHGYLNALGRLSHDAHRQYWRLHGHPENWPNHHKSTNQEGEN